MIHIKFSEVQKVLLETFPRSAIVPKVSTGQTATTVIRWNYSLNNAVPIFVLTRGCSAEKRWESTQKTTYSQQNFKLILNQHLLAFITLQTKT